MTINEVSQKYGLTQDTLRYYEKEGLIPPVNRTRGGMRDYTEADCGWVSFIKHMRAAGISVEALREYVRLFNEGENTRYVRRQLLIDQREKIARRIEELNDILARLDRKIEGYDSLMETCENDLNAFGNGEKTEESA